MFKEFFYRILWFIFFECLPVFLKETGKAPKIHFRGQKPTFRPNNRRDFK